MITYQYDTILIIFDNRWPYLAIHIIIIASCIRTYVAIAVYIRSLHKFNCTFRSVAAVSIREHSFYHCMLNLVELATDTI